MLIILWLKSIQHFKEFGPILDGEVEDNDLTWDEILNVWVVSL